MPPSAATRHGLGASSDRSDVVRITGTLRGPLPISRQALAACIVAALGLLRPAPALATSDEPASRESARALADQAANAYAQGDYARAVQLLNLAYQLVPAPTIALLEARALVRLGRLVQARGVYARVLRTPLTAEAPPVYRSAVVDARAELGTLEPRIPKLKVVLALPVDQLNVTLDGRSLPADSLGVWLALDPGSHTLTAEEVSSGRVRSEAIALTEGARRQVSIQGFEPPPRTGLPLGIAAFALGGIGVGVGVATGLVAVGAHDDAVRGCPNRACESGSAGAQALDRFGTYRTISTVSYVIGAAGLGLGAYVVLTSARSSRPTLALGPTLHGVRIEGSL